MSTIATDQRYMAEALALALRGSQVAPNPLVGAVVVVRGRVVGRGYHARYGGPHAEVAAIRQAGTRAYGATLYVTLEPCAHHGHTPPCTEAILAAGIHSVVYAMRDPHPRVRGRGVRTLRRAGIRVRGRVLTAQAEAMNVPFTTVQRTGRPYVTVKMAQTLDGKIATAQGHSRWITGMPARRVVHRMRRGAGAVLVGVNTVLADNPRLGVHMSGRPSHHDPQRIIVDSRCRTPLASHVVRCAKTHPVLIATSAQAPAVRCRALRRRGVTVEIFPVRRGHVNLRAVTRWLACAGVNHVLIEGGGEIVASALEQHLVDHVVWFTAPKIIGGRAAPTAVGGDGYTLPRAIRLVHPTTTMVGQDMMVRGDVRYA
jgi:diaminohydroxyphosphoribosylaminopyrimidine deaminase / 5-amino-6-(5-phosphoribosylamino)uracil reductase